MLEIHPFLDSFFSFVKILLSGSNVFRQFADRELWIENPPVEAMLKGLWEHIGLQGAKRRTVDLDAEIKAFEKCNIRVKITDLSLEDCCLATQTVLVNRKHVFLEHMGSRQMQLQIYLPQTSIQTTARVKWFKFIESGRKFAAGLNFESMKNADRDCLQQYLKGLPLALSK